jgi:hypothetical protein
MERKVMSKYESAFADAESVTPAAPMPERYGSESEIEAIVRAFEACTLPGSLWTHGAHLTVAGWYLDRYSGHEAAARIRAGIKRYNAARGIVSTPTGGYHETMTLFWTCITSKYLMLADPDRPLVDLINMLIDKHRDKNLIFEYYSRDLLFSRQARFSWVEPDLKPIR